MSGGTDAMRVPSPAQLLIGTDIIKHSRIYHHFSHKPDRLLRLTKRLLRTTERTLLASRYPGWQDISSHSTAHQSRIASWLAGRWAAKEAARKAWGAQLVGFGDLRVDLLEGGAVEIICRARRTNVPPSAHDAVVEQAARLSISHDGDYVVATVLANPLHPDIKAALGRQGRRADRVGTGHWVTETEDRGS